MRHVFLLVFVVVGAGIISMYLRGDEDSSFRTVVLRGIRVSVELANTPEKQTRGLSGKVFLGEQEGMLFVFDSPRTPSFWMKDMRFPLDILWIGEDNRIIDIDRNISPASFPQKFSPEGSVKYVLEVNAGWAEKYSVVVGDVMTW